MVRGACAALLALLAMSCSAPDQLVGHKHGEGETTGGTTTPGGQASSSSGTAEAESSGSGSGGGDEVECSFFASPTGGGDGLSEGSAFTVAAFWAEAQPGHTLCLLDGTYRGDEAMVAPPAGLQGDPEAPITVRALHDGGVVLDGELARVPIRLDDNDHFVIEGLDAHSSSGPVINMHDSTGVVVRRTIAWDGFDPENTHIVICWGDGSAVLEDIAVFGTGRTAVNASCPDTTLRRAWARWEGNHFVGPKATFLLHAGTRCEDCIGTWDGLAMQESYTLACPEGTDYAPCGTLHENYRVDQPYAVFQLDGEEESGPIELAGVLAYQTETQRIAPLFGLFFGVGSPDGTSTLQDVVALRSPGLASIEGRTFNVSAVTGGPVVAVGGIPPAGESDPLLPPEIGPLHTAPDLATLGDLSALVDLCHRHEETDGDPLPLWPWPMDDRIEAALSRAGRTPLRVTDEVAGVLGSSLSRCPP